nr:helix-turn-helix domain-containing protein [Streptomyces olivoreticuli]
MTVSKQLRVSVRSVRRWRRSWQNGGPQALRSRGRPPTAS